MKVRRGTPTSAGFPKLPELPEPSRLSARTLPDPHSGVGWGLITHSLGALDALCRARCPQGCLGPKALPSTQQHSLLLAPPLPTPCPQALPMGMLLPIPEPQPSPVPRPNHGDAGCRACPPTTGSQGQAKAYLPRCPSGTSGPGTEAHNCCKDVCPQLIVRPGPSQRTIKTQPNQATKGIVLCWGEQMAPASVSPSVNL